MKRSFLSVLFLSCIMSGCATTVPRDCSIVPPALSNYFGSEDGYDLFVKSNRFGSGNFSERHVAYASEYLARTDTTEAGREYFLHKRAMSYTETDQEALALADYKTLSTMPNIKADKRAYFSNVIETDNFSTDGTPMTASRNVVDATPLVRIPPLVPQSFMNRDNSGHCAVRFDVDPEGKVINAETEYCTHDDLKEASLASVALWKYSPKTVDGKAVIREDIRSTIRFALQDECGYLFPE